MSERAVLPLIERLCDALAASDVDYCHWKSNAQIDRSESGANDLDLLIRRSHIARFRQTLRALTFAHAHKQGANVPAIESYYGFDSEAGRLVHVHAHYELVLGHDATKNYRLPLEEAFLDSATRVGVFPLPAAELEFAVFVIRMVLKYCIWDEIAWSASRRRRPTLKPSERRELEDLVQRADPVAVSRVLQEQLPYVGEELFEDCLACIASDVSTRERMRVARRLETSLEPYARHSRRVDAALRLYGRAALAVRFRVRRRPRNRLATGAIIGVMGGDGAGKSTAIAELGRWLERDFDVRTIHLGKPRWSATTWLTRAGLKAAVHASARLERAVPTPSIRRVSGVLGEYRPLVWFLCVARDRRRTYRAARRFAAAGGLVISDRYPHERLKLMDVPQIARVAGPNDQRRLVRAMARLEERYHAAIAPPELLVALRLDPEIAAVRKTTEPSASVRERGAEIWNADWDGSVHVVDANQPPEVVAAELKALVWSTVT